MSRVRFIILFGVVLLVLVGGALAVCIPLVFFTSPPLQTPTPAATRTPAYHLTATRQRGEILFQLDTWYLDARHQRTDIQVTLATGDSARRCTPKGRGRRSHLPLAPPPYWRTSRLLRDQSACSNGKRMCSLPNVQPLAWMQQSLCRACRAGDTASAQRTVDHFLHATRQPTQGHSAPVFAIPLQWPLTPDAGRRS